MAEHDADLIIIGAGPAGLSAAQYGARANLKVLVFEELAPGGQALNIDVLENYPGNVGAAGDPAAKGGPKSGFDFSQDLQRQAEQFGAVFLMESVSAVKKNGDHFTVSLGSGDSKTAAALIVATGAKHQNLGIEGEEQFSGRGVSYCATCDGPFFKEKKIFVVGGGDAACDEAQYLSHLSPQVILIHRRDRFRAQKAIAERVLCNKNIEVRFNTAMKEIKGSKKVSSVILEQNDGGAAKQYEEDADAVFVVVGMIPQSQIAADAGAKLDEHGYIITDMQMASSLSGLFAAGDVVSGTFRQVVVACGSGAIAANSASKYIDELRGQAYK
jgi:thioredoxin reductase (NADPH)